MITYQSMSDYVMRNIAGDHVLVKTQNSEYGSTNVFVFNDSGALLWQILSEKKSRAQLVALLTDQYGIGQTQAESDVDQFLDKCIAEGFIAEDKEGI